MAEHREERVRALVDGLVDPLTAIIGNSQLLARDHGLDETARERVRTIELEAELLRDQIAALRQLLAGQHGTTGAPSSK